MHRRLAVPMLPSRVWVHCPRASNGLLPPRSYLVGYMRWHARSDSSFCFVVPRSDNHSNSFQFANEQTFHNPANTLHVKFEPFCRVWEYSVATTFIVSV